LSELMLINNAFADIVIYTKLSGLNYDFSYIRISVNEK